MPRNCMRASDPKLQEIVTQADIDNRKFGDVCRCGHPKSFHEAKVVNGPRVGPCYRIRRSQGGGCPNGCKTFRQ